MARLTDQDFARLAAFLDQYTLADTLKSKTREQLIKRGHKYCLAALQMWAIAEQLVVSKNLQVKGVKVKHPSPQLDQISECFSDITSSFFAALHGLYKPAHMSLRSATETFTRGIAGLYSAEALTTTSVFRLFEIAGTCDAFLNDSRPHFDALHQEYVLLCEFTHTATPAHMVKNHAMSAFPKQDIDNLRVWVRHHETTITAILSILLFSDRNLYLRASPHSQDVFDDVIPKDARLFALGAPK